MAGSAFLSAMDEKVIGEVRAACQRAAVTLQVASSVSEAETEAGDVDVVICPDRDFEPVSRLWPRAAVIIYAETTDSRAAIEAIKRGAHDYVIRPIRVEQLAQQIESAVSVSRDIHRGAVYEQPLKDRDDVDRLIGQSPAMQDVYKAIGRIAPRDINVLITGESGTGKELVARAILHHSPRRGKPFLAVNCAAIPDTLLEAELFGHEKGAFTGADRRRTGKFEQCDGGTLFLDEIGDIPLPTQAKLLRVLQDQTFQRLGGSEVIRCDVRIIAATHQPLERLISRGRFRRDLFYRLNVASIHIPPLREREVDVVLLAHHFVEKHNREFGAQIRAFAAETLPILLRYPWPGNVRELENAIKATLVMARGTVLRPEFLPDWIREPGEHPGSADARPAADGAATEEDRPIDQTLERATEMLMNAPGGEAGVFRSAISRLERELIRQALRRTRGRLAPAARLLGISRATLRRKARQYAIDITAV